MNFYGFLIILINVLPKMLKFGYMDSDETGGSSDGSNGVAPGRVRDLSY